MAQAKQASSPPRNQTFREAPSNFDIHTSARGSEFPKGLEQVTDVSNYNLQYAGYRKVGDGRKNERGKSSTPWNTGREERQDNLKEFSIHQEL